MTRPLPGRPGIHRERVVAVVATLPAGREQVGSGYLIDGRLVLTAEHCTRDKVTGAAPLGLRVIRATDGLSSDKIEVAASRLLTWPSYACARRRGTPRCRLRCLAGSTALAQGC